MKSLTEAQLANIIKKAWRDGCVTGFRKGRDYTNDGPTPSVEVFISWEDEEFIKQLIRSV